MIYPLFRDSPLINLTCNRIKWEFYVRTENEIVSEYLQKGRFMRMSSVSRNLESILNYHGSRRSDLVYCETAMKSLTRNRLRVVQFRIHSSYRTEVRPRNPHTPKPKLALVDTVQAPVARVWNR